MMDTLALFTETLWRTVGDVAPILAVIFGFQVLVLRRRIPHFVRVARGVLCVVLGLVLFLMGLDQALFPLGRTMAEQLTSAEFIHGSEATAGEVTTGWRDYYAVYLFAFTIGISTVLMEPAVFAVALKAERLSGGTINGGGLRLAIAVGVGAGVALGVFRIVSGGSLHWFILGAYCLVVVQTLFAPRHMIPLAYDSGGVSTSTVTVPIVAALGLGLASTLPGRSPLLDGFGMIALAVIGPVIAVLAYAELARWWAKRTERARINQ